MDKTYCIFGDSVTQAAYVKVGWVQLFKQYLEDKYKDDFVNVFELGIGGNTTDDILKRFQCESSARNPDSILFAVGINDTKFNSSEQFKNNLVKLIEQAKIFTQEITFIGLVLGDYKGEDPFTTEKATDYNRIVKEVSESNNCKFIQLRQILKPSDFMDDLHPNEQGHIKMFEVIKGYF